MGQTEDTNVTKEHVAKAITRRSFLRNTAAVAAGGMGALYLGGAGATALAADTKTIPPSAAAAVDAAGTGLSPAKIQVKEITQIAIAAPNIKQMLNNYYSILGVKDWALLDWGPREVYDREYRGKKAAADEWIAVTEDLRGTDESGKARGCQFEIVTPGRKPSIYADFLAERKNPGIHHIQFQVDSIDAVYDVHDAMAEFGFKSIQNGKFGKRTGNPGMFSYIDLQDPLGAIWEPVYMGGGADGPAITVPANPKPTHVPKVTDVPFISQLGVVVRDVEEACWNYWNLLGIGPWTVIDWEYPLVYDRRYHGELHWARDKIALCMLGGVEFELTGWYQGPSGYKDWIDQYGQSINHIQYLVPSWQDVYVHGEKFEKAGFPPIGSGTFGNPGSEGAYLYADCNKTLGSIWEPVRNGGANAINGNNAPRTIPPNADTYNYGR